MGVKKHDDDRVMKEASNDVRVKETNDDVKVKKMFKGKGKR